MFTIAQRSHCGRVLGSAGLLASAGLLVWKAKPFLRAIRTASEWVDYSPAAPFVIVAVALAAIAALCLWRRAGAPRSRPVHVLHIVHCSTPLWEGQETLCVSDARTARIRFVLHSRKRAS